MQELWPIWRMWLAGLVMCWWVERHGTTQQTFMRGWKQISSTAQRVKRSPAQHSAVRRLFNLESGADRLSSNR
jgi:hypothetical protein